MSGKRWWYGHDKKWHARGETPVTPIPPSTPTAAFTTQIVGRTVSFDASASKDAGSTLTAYAWTFGDGTAGAGKTLSHTYAADGSFTAVLTVTDANNASATATETVAVVQIVGAPTAAFTFTTVNLAAQFDASTSTDPTATITSYAWKFGDNTTGTGKTAAHTYATGGSYTATLTVTDSTGKTATSSHTVTVSAPVRNQAPTASFSIVTAGATITVNGSASTDVDGSISKWVWTFGDGTTATGATASHTYATSGTYTVTLVVTDNAGATGTAAKSVPVGSTPTNQPPTAAFAATVNQLTVAFDGSASSDPDGTIAAYAWTFGDGATGTGKTATHTYASAGTYTVNLTVTDNLGATDTTAKSVTATAATGTGTGGDSGINQTGVAGQTQAGTVITNVLGATISGVGAGVAASLPAGTYTLTNFAESWGGSTNLAGAAITKAIKALLGAGSASTVIQLPQNTTPLANTANGHYLIAHTGALASGFVLDGIHLKGNTLGDGSNDFGGIWLSGSNGLTISNCTFESIRGSGGGPPQETFYVNIQSQAGGVANVLNTSWIGHGIGAAGLGTNTTPPGAVVNITNFKAQDFGYSAGIATWNNKGTINCRNATMTNVHRNFGAENNGGTINIYNPIWDDALFASGGGHDFNITWTNTYNEGIINVYFDADANWQAFIKNRTRKYIYPVVNQGAGLYSGTYGNYSGSKHISDTFHVFVGGVEQTGSNRSKYVQGVGNGWVS